jgi:hypothetical protein
MPRNGSGTYSLPSGNPVVPSTTIQSTWANSTLTDVGDALTGSLARDGTGGMSGALRLADGTVAIPGLAFTAETTTGFSRPTTNALVASVSAIERLRINASGATVSGTLGVTSDVAVNTNKFNVTAASGDTSIAGTLGVAGLITATGGVSGAVTSSSATITGGTINGTAIGGTTAAAGAFTTLGYTSTLTGGTGVVNIGSGQIYKDASGNVGIGTSSPIQKLSVAGNGNFSAANARVIAGNTSGTASDITMGADSGVGWIGSASNNVPIYFATNNTERMRIDTSGNVGIGRSPAYKLDAYLSGTGSPAIASSNDIIVTILQSSGSTQGNVGTITSHPLVLLTGNTERMRLDTSGNLQFNSGYGSVATAFGCRAWVNFDGTLSSPISPRGSGNVSSVTKNGTGSYAVNLITAMPDNNYAANVTVGFTSAGTHIGEISSNGVSASILNIFTVGGSTVADFPLVTVAIFR